MAVECIFVRKRLENNQIQKSLDDHTFVTVQNKRKLKQ